MPAPWGSACKGPERGLRGNIESREVSDRAGGTRWMRSYQSVCRDAVTTSGVGLIKRAAVLWNVSRLRFETMY